MAWRSASYPNSCGKRVLRTMRSATAQNPARIYPSPDCSPTRVTFAPADDGALTVSRHAAMAIDVMPVTSGVAAVDDAVAKVKAVGVELFGFG
jgi:hypothetical protein